MQRRAFRVNAASAGPLVQQGVERARVRLVRVVFEAIDHVPPADVI